MPLSLKKITPKVAVKDLLKLHPLRSEIETFKTNLIALLNKVDEKEREENQKNNVRDFLLQTYYQGEYEINTKDTKDLVIHLGKTNKDKVGVIIEAKRTGSKTEMLSLERPNSKALHELVLYYLRERINHKNIDLKYCIVTDVYNWYIIEAQYFEKVFAQNKNFITDYKDWTTGKKVLSDNPFFYNEIVKPYLNSVDEEIPCVYFNIKDYERELKNENKADDKKLLALYKILSPYFLLKKSFINDSNSLNDKFYKELLHIIGLEEVKEGSKMVIRRKSKDRHAGSLIENTITILETEDALHRIKDVNIYGSNYEERIFNVALELSLTWINRVLFLKLLEGQLISYNNGNRQYSFLNIENIYDFDELYKLFHQVLAVSYDKRSEAIQQHYSLVPYLNSSLFEINTLENETIRINSLNDKASLPYMANSVLREAKKKEEATNTLCYLFQFLDTYNFASEDKDDIQEDTRLLINASVLGKIFEKINGYKDGSIFTPGFITMYMCRETLRMAVVNKFNQHYSWECKTLNDIYNKITNLNEANTIINSLKICDPAVGSGHFLVSALNELIAIKAELKILQDTTGKRLKHYSIEVLNDELIITDEDGEPFAYNSKNKESQRVQETLFHEKEILIENCLFGADINPNSVKICRLRLWIELLKNAYYKNNDGRNELETLPNIDINIKFGNSLLSRYALDEELSDALKSTGHTISEYKEAVNNYKTAVGRNENRIITKLINDIKNGFETYFSAHDERRKKLSKARGELVKLQSDNLFESKKTDPKVNRDIEKQQKIITQLTNEIEEIKNNVIYKNSFEWRFEFPEVLDNEGNFEGFDVVLGNPPYIQLQKMGSMTDVLQKQGYEVFVRTGDIYCLFYELGMHLLKPEGLLCYITSNKWMRAGYGQALRTYFLTKTNPLQLIDFAGLQLFDSATVDTNILLIQKASYKGSIQTCVLDGSWDSLNNLSDYFRQKNLLSNFNPESSWIVSSAIEQDIKTKIESIGIPLKDWNIKIYRGILTGLNEAFIITDEIKDQLVKKHPNSIEIIKPILRGRDIQKYKPEWASLYIIATHNGYIDSDGNYIKPIDVENYPAIKEHLDQYWEKIRTRQDKGISPYNLRSCIYMEDFFRPKIIYPEITKFINFYLDYNKHYFVNNKCFIITGEYVEFLTAFFNSSLFKFCFINSFPELLGGTRELRKVFLEKIPVLLITAKQNKNFKEKVLKIQEMKLNGMSTIDLEKQIDDMIFDLYNLTEEERQKIGFITIS